MAFSAKYDPVKRTLVGEDGENISEFIRGMRARVDVGDPDIKIEDLRKYDHYIGERGGMHLREQWEEAKARRAVRDLIAECAAKPGPNDGTLEMQHRTNRLLAAILENLHGG